MRPSAAPIPNAQRHPSQIGSQRGSSSTRVAAAPSAAPIQYEPLIIKSTRPRTQLVDRRIDRRIFSTDAGAGQRTKNSIAGEVPGKRGQRRADQINGDRYEEEFLSAKTVRS